MALDLQVFMIGRDERRGSAGPKLAISQRSLSDQRLGKTEEARNLPQSAKIKE